MSNEERGQARSSSLGRRGYNPYRLIPYRLVTRCLISLLLLLAGCALPRSTPPIIKIGMIAPFEGLYRPDSYAALYAVKLALHERNAAGGVAGYRVELVALNDDGDPAQAAFQARKLAVDPDVMGVVGPFSRTTAAAAAPFLAEAGLAWVAPVSVPDEVVRAYPNAFRLFASDQALATALIEWASTVIGEGGGVWVPDAGSFVRPLREAAAQAGILQAQPPGRRAGTEAPPLRIPVLALGEDAEQAADLLREWDGEIMIGGPEAAGMVTLQRAGSAATGLVWATSLQVIAWPEPFIRGYQELAGGPPGPEAALAYDATQVLLDAFARAADPKGFQKPFGSATGSARAGVVAALGTTRWNGLNGPIAFDANGSWINAPVRLYRVTNGQRFGESASQ